VKRDPFIEPFLIGCAYATVIWWVVAWLRSA